MLNADADLLADTEAYVPAQQPLSVHEQVELLKLWESKPQIYVYNNGVASLSAIFDGEDSDNARWYDGDEYCINKWLVFNAYVGKHLKLNATWSQLDVKLCGCFS
eukprot:COSAG02_NODE_6863_length_3318_cov_9.683753_2_plen_105_part_00